MNYEIIIALLAGALGGVIHQYIEGNVKNTWKNIRRGLIFGAIGSFIALFVLGMAIDGFDGIWQIIVGGLVFGYSGDSITINYAKRKFKGFAHLLDEDYINEIIYSGKNIIDGSEITSEEHEKLSSEYKEVSEILDDL